MLKIRAGFLDLESLTFLSGGVLQFNPLLPGYLRDLQAFYPRIFGIYLNSWKGCSLVGEVDFEASLPLVVVDDTDVEPSLWGVCRKYDISLHQSVIFSSFGSRILQVSDRLGLRKMTPVPRSLLQF